MASEDFAYYLQEIPGCFFFTCNIPPHKEAVSCHSSHFDFNDKLIPVGAAMFAGIVEKRFEIKF
jgi:metal-dependent amidase/aminoacylase/carboxypeptidase family protein